MARRRQSRQTPLRQQRRHTLAAYTRQAYAGLTFVELTPFVAFRERHWPDDDFRALQGLLLLAPEAGDLIKGGAGLRKLRWPVGGHGKRGGARVIYYRDTAGHRIYLIHAYLKNECSDLTPRQTATLAELIRDITRG